MQSRKRRNNEPEQLTENAEDEEMEMDNSGSGDEEASDNYEDELDTDTKNPRTSTKREQPKYMSVCFKQTDECRIIALVSNPLHFPLAHPFLRVPISTKINLSQKLLVSKVKPCTAFIHDTLHTEFAAEEMQILGEVKTQPSMGIICNKNDDSVLVLTPGNKQGNWREINFPVKQWDIVDCDVVKLPSGIQLGPDFILPQNFQAGFKFPRSSTGTELVQRVEPLVYSHKFPCENESDVELACTCIGLAIRACAENIKNLGSQHSLWASLTEIEENIYTLTFFPQDLFHLVAFKQIWQKDCTVVIREEYREKAFAVGVVRKTEHLDGPNLKITISAKPTEGRESIDLNDGREYLLEVPLSPKKLELRAEKFLWGSIESALKNDTEQAKILKILLGLGTNDPNTWEAPPIHSKLNKEQNKVLYILIHKNGTVTIMLAPPGTGKTYSLGVMANELLEDGEVILCVTNSNISLLKLVEDLSPLVKSETKQMLVQSGTAREEFKSLTERFSKFLLIAHESELCEELKGKAKRLVKAYKGNMDKRPRVADDRTIAPILNNKMDFKVYYATTAMAEEMQGVFTKVTTLIVDEAGQCPINSIIPLAANLPNLKKLIIAGDKHQLGVFAGDTPAPLSKGNFGFNSSLEYLSKQKGVDLVKLKTTYRSHPFIVECLKQAVYGEDLQAGLSEGERQEFCNSIPLPNKKVPILIIQAKGEDLRDQFSFSRQNSLHTQLTVDTLDALAQLCAPNLSIIVICVYAHQAAKIKMRTKFQVYTIDSFQAQQSDITIVVTTRSKDIDTEHAPAVSFVCNPERSVVALSRAKHGLIVIGDLDILRQGKIWSKFLDHALLHTEVVGETYVQMLLAHADREREKKKPTIEEIGGPIGERLRHLTFSEEPQQFQQQVPCQQMQMAKQAPQMAAPFIASVNYPHFPSQNFPQVRFPMAPSMPLAQQQPQFNLPQHNVAQQQQMFSVPQFNVPPQQMHAQPMAHPQWQMDPQFILWRQQQQNMIRQMAQQQQAAQAGMPSTSSMPSNAPPPSLFEVRPRLEFNARPKK